MHEKKASAIKKHGIDRQSINSDSEDLDLGKRSFFMTNISTTTHPRLLQPWGHIVSAFSSGFEWTWFSSGPYLWNDSSPWNSMKETCQGFEDWPGWTFPRSAQCSNNFQVLLTVWGWCSLKLKLMHVSGIFKKTSCDVGGFSMPYSPSRSE